MSLQKFRDLLAKAYTDQAIDHLVKCSTGRENDDANILRSRLSQLQSQITNGIVSDSNAGIERNKIVYSAQEVAKRVWDEPAEVQSTSSREQTSVVKALQTLYRENHRRRPAEAAEIKVLLGDYQNYDGEKALKPSYDPSGRRRKALDARFQVLAHRLKEAKDDGLEAFVDRVTELLSDPIPVYNDLDEAYRLIAGRGCQDRWVETQLTNRPDDMETRIQVAEKLEDLLTTAKQR